MVPENCKYTEDHEWVKQEEGVCVVGITDFAQEQLGDITYVELPEEGADVAKGASVGMVESVKAASDVYAPVGGKVSAVNTALEDQPELVNQSPYEDGWFFKLEGAEASELNNLMDAAAYEAFLEEQQE